MRSVQLSGFNEPGGTILCIGAHCDDIEIGCGGTLLKLLEQNPNLHCRWIVFSGSPERARECRNAAERFLSSAQEKSVEVLGFRDGFLPACYEQVKEEFENIKGQVDPTLVFTHCRNDRHQDHRLLCELTWNTWRDHLILEYEIPKYDGDLGNPNLFVGLEEKHCRCKSAHLLECYVSQRSKHWFTEDTFRGLLRLRGIESAAETGWAEAFYAPKLVM